MGTPFFYYAWTNMTKIIINVYLFGNQFTHLLYPAFFLKKTLDKALSCWYNIIVACEKDPQRG